MFGVRLIVRVPTDMQFCWCSPKCDWYHANFVILYDLHVALK